MSARARKARLEPNARGMCVCARCAVVRCFRSLKRSQDKKKKDIEQKKKEEDAAEAALAAAAPSMLAEPQADPDLLY